MTEFERDQVYFRCIACCEPLIGIERDATQSACHECWRLRRSFTTDMRRVVICQAIPPGEWERND